MTTENDDLFSLYFQYIAGGEAPTIYHRWSLIAATGAFLGRQFWLPMGDSRVFPNQYVMLIGNPGTRKSTAIKRVAKVLRQAGYKTFSAEKTTKEKFLLDLEGHEDAAGLQGTGRDGSKPNGERAADILATLDLADDSPSHDGVPREVFITADEFNEFAGTGNLDFLSMLGALWDWDDEGSAYSQRFKNSKSISIYQPTLSILGGNTHAGFQLAFPEAAIGQGFLSRLILVYSEPSGRKVTFPVAPDERIAVALMEKFHAIKQNVKGPAQRTNGASQALDTIYRTWQDLDDSRFKAYSTRRFTHLLKLCLVVTAMRGSVRIDQPDVLLANTILSYTENSMPKALGEYGRSRNSTAAHNLMTALYEARAPMNIEELYKVVQRDLDKRDQILDLIRNLQEAGKVVWVKDAGGFIARQKVMNTRAVFVTPKLLKEYSE